MTRTLRFPKIDRICEKCGEHFLAKPSEVAKGAGKFCSRDCANASRKRRSIEDRFWEKVHKTDSCWNWTASTNAGGYGEINRGGDDNIKVGAHILSWEIHNGPVPEGIFVCHTCDNRLCVRPKHLFLGTHQDNVDDMMAKGRNQHGPSHHAAKLDEDAIRDIRSRWKFRKVTMPQLAEEYGVGKVTIWQIIHRETWNNVSD